MKTAVEFYREKNIELLEELRLGLITHLHWYQKQAIIFEQAKEMEKEQIKDAYKADLHPCSDDDAEQYYNETFKQQEQ